MLVGYLVKTKFWLNYGFNRYFRFTCICLFPDFKSFNLAFIVGRFSVVFGLIFENIAEKIDNISRNL